MTTFKTGPDRLNQIFDEAGIEDVTMSLSPQGQLRLDTDLTGVQTINRLISGLVTLYAKLITARGSA